MKTLTPFLILSFLFVVSCSYDSEKTIIHYETSIAQAVSASKLVLPSENLKTPFLLIFDAAGSLIDIHIGWEGRDSIDTLINTLSRNGDGASLAQVKKVLGQDVSSSDEKIILAISLGSRCPPCIEMERDLSESIKTLGNPVIEIYSVTFDQRQTAPKTP